ncbi:MAG: glycoside hydrolase family 65 protein [Deinococcus-Thermus bacterium]|jgi:kojibiose phosphorylase|nr:glycoside hydrolase family 65 protein [Deinococcota bacterium]
MRLPNGLVAEGGWALVEDRFDPAAVIPTGSAFMVGNGHLGYRGTFEEWDADRFVATIVAGTYDLADGTWRELVNAPNGLYLTLQGPDDQPIGVADATPEAYERRLDLHRGVFSRRHAAPVGNGRVVVESERFASLTRRRLLAQRTRLTAEAPVTIEVCAGIDGRVWDLHGPHLTTMQPVEVDGAETLALEGRTAERDLPVVVAERLGITGRPPVSTTGAADPDGRRVVRRMTVSLDTGESVEFDKLVFVATGFEADDPRAVIEADLAALEGVGYDGLRDEHVAAWAAFWADADVVVEGDPEAQTALRFCLYQNRIAARADADHLPLGARGLSCQAYQGAAFWDQEIYNLPAFLFTRPEIARNLLVYRWKTLDGARRKAARLGCRGAYFAWISGDTGDELCPTHFFKDVLTGRPIRTHFGDRQIHVSPDVVYAIWQYWRATGDLGFVRDHGAEIAFEVARFLRSWAYRHEERGRYEILRVLGPDEWHEDIDNNAYTNWIAAFALDQAVAIHHRLAREAPASLAALAERIGLDRAEVDAWADMAERLYRPAPDPETGLIAQFDGFFDLEDVAPPTVAARLLDPAEYWGGTHGVAVETQVSKQADVVQLMALLPDRFDAETIRANWHYYEPRCQHGSSLSAIAHAIAAARMGDTRAAYAYFIKGATVDLYATQKAMTGGTFIGGIHTAACAGAWQVAVQGFAGLDLTDDALVLDPALPEGWDRLAFRLAYRGDRLSVEVTPTATTVTADPDNAGMLDLILAGRRTTLHPGGTARGGPPE